MALETTEIVAAFGALYMNTGQGMADLHKLLNFKSATDMIGMPVVTDNDNYQASVTLVNEIIQPFQKLWTPKGTEEFQPVEIRQRRIKADKEVYPDEVRASWLGFLVNEGLDRTQYPLIRYLIENIYIPQIKEDYEMEVIYKGVYAAPVSGVPGAANTAMDGIKKILNDHITAGRIVPITTGALSANKVTFVEQIEDFTDQISERYWGARMFLAMSPANAKKYARGYKEKYGTTLSYNENQRYEVDNANIEIVGLPSMIGSEKIWSTTHNNFARIYKETPRAVPMEVQSVDRLVKMFTDFARGVGFIVPQAVFTNDQEL